MKSVGIQKMNQYMTHHTVFLPVTLSVPWYSNITVLQQEIPVKEDEGEACCFYY